MNDNTTALPKLEGNGIDEQLLKDFIATAQESGYDYDVVLPKFPELAGYDLQLLKDYIATAEENDYDYAVVNPKFPELFSVKKKDEPTESFSEVGSSEPSEVATSFEPIDPNQGFTDEARESIGNIDVAPEDPRIVEQNRVLQQDYDQRYSPEATAKFAAREIEDAEKIDLSIKKREAEALKLDEARASVISTPEVEAVLAQVNPALVDLEEEEVVAKMRSLFAGRGFTFEEIGLGMDRMRVRTTDGRHSIEVELDNFTNATNVAESAALQVFLRKHFNPTLLPDNQDEITKALRAQQMRGTQELWNDDGTSSSVMFMSYEEDGIHKVAPTLFPNSTTQQSSPRAEDWMRLDMGEAIDEAERRGEVISFDSQEEAEAFAQGSWKTTNLVDVEAQKFFNERGRDYLSDRDAYDRYSGAHETRLFLEEQMEIQQDTRWDDAGQFDDLSPAEQAAYGQYFRKDGSLRGDAAEVAEALDRQEGDLWDIVNNDDYRRAQEDLDVHLEGIHRKTAQEAANLNYEAKYIERELEAEVLEEFGINLDQISVYQPKTEEERVMLNEVIGQYNSIQTKKETAALRYETALTYYDAKANKEATLEYLDNLEGWAVATNDGYKNGRAAQQLLYLSMGIYDVEDEAQLELAVSRMTGHMNSVDGRQSRALSRMNSAEDGWNREVRGALSRDPIETIMTWTASSLSQIVPYGAKIIPSFAAAGASAGALAGLAGGPWAPLTSSAGAATGLGWGVRAGFAATNLVLEYTNGILDAGREKGYNMSDPQEALKALQDEEVWAHGRERGLKRGIPIALMDVIGGGLAGRVFTGASVASRTRKAAGFVAERLTIDPMAEATGELLAQINVGDEISFKEILAEAGGAIGNQTAMASINIYRATRGGYNQRIAESLMDTKLMAKERGTAAQIQRWTNNMLKLKKISPEQGQRILENVGLREEANDLLGVTGPSRVGVGAKQRRRVMELLDVRAGLESSSNRKSVFSSEISRINEELSEISRTGKLSESPIDLYNTNKSTGKTFNTQGGTRSQVPRYRIGGVSYSKADFVDYIENLTPRRVDKILKDSEITNDEEMSILLESKLKPFDTEVSEQTTDNAIQESSTAEVDVQQPTTDSEEVGEGDVVTEPAETAEAQDEVDAAQEEEVIDRGTKEDVKAFRDKTIAPERKRALLAGVAKRLNEKKKLTKFQQEMAAENSFEIAEMQGEQEALALETADLEASLAANEVSKPRSEEAAPEEEVVVDETPEPVVDETPETKPKKKGLLRRAADRIEKALGTHESRTLAEAEELENAEVKDEVLWADYQGNIEYQTALDEEQTEEEIKVKALDMAKIQAKRRSGEIEFDEVLAEEVAETETTEAVEETTKESLLQDKRDLLLESVEARKKFGTESGALQRAVKNAATAEAKAEAKKSLIELRKKEAARRKKFKSDEREIYSQLSAVEEGSTTRPEFRMKGESLGVSLDEQDTETMEILEAMNVYGAQVQVDTDTEIAELEAKLETPGLLKAKRESINAKLSELRNSRRTREIEGKATKIDVAELNSRLDNPLPVVSWKVVEGVPMIFNISDQLRTGDVVNPTTGNTIGNLKGGLGFTGVRGHENHAWASINEGTAKRQIDTATKVYKDNKEVFEEWWAANPDYKGLVPMTIVKMGQESILSNEAVVRVLADNVKNFPEVRRAAALVAFKKEIQNQINTLESTIERGVNKKGNPLTPTTMKNYRKDISARENVLDVVKELEAKRVADGITGRATVDMVLTPEALGMLKALSSVNIITKTVMSGDVNEVGKKKKKPGKGKTLVALALLGENPTQSEIASLNRGVITDLLTEPQLEGVPQRSAFLIQGIDVLNPAVLETNHPNYQYGPRGKTIGVLEQPQSIMELFPAMANNVALAVAREQKGVKPRLSEKNRLSESNPLAMGLTNLEFLGSVHGMTERGAILDYLNRAFPSVNVSVDTQTFENVMASEGVKEYLKGDEVVYGVTKDGDVYLNPDVHNSESALYNTAVHEFGHVWTDYLQTTPEGRALYAKGASLVSQTAEYKNQLKNFKGTTDEKGNTLTEEQVKKRAVNEAMAILIGNKGESILDASLKQKFQEWAAAVWAYVKETFTMSKDLTPEAVEKLTLDEFLGTAMADILSGEKLSITQGQIKKLKNPEAAFSMSDSMNDVISRGRAEGFSEASIRQVLISRGHKVADIKAKMKMNMDLFSESVVPFEFGNVEGGMSAGIRLYQSVQSEVADFAAPNERRTGVRMTARERAQRVSDLREMHPTLLPEEVSDASLLRRFPRRGTQGETVTTQKTPAEVRAKALDVLRNNPVFMEQSEAIQMELVVAMDRALGIRANRAVSKEITAIRATLTQRKRAVREVEAVKRQLRQFIRRSLPKSRTYSQADINKLIRSVERVNQDNYRVQVEKILQVVEAQRARMRTAVLKKLLKDVTKGATKTVTAKKLNKAKSLDPDGQGFSVQLKRVLQLAMKPNDEVSVKALQELVGTLETDEALEAFAKEAAGETLTQKEQGLVNLAVALDLAKNVDTMSLEEVEGLAHDYKVAATQSRQYLSEIRKARARKSDALRQKISDSLRKSNPELFNENGTLKGKNETDAIMDSVRRYWNEGKGEGMSARLKGQVKAAKLYVNTYKGRTIPQLIKSLVNGLKHLGTFLSSINETVHEEIFNRLNRLDNSSLKGYFKQQDFLRSIGYEAVQQSLFDTKKYTIRGLIDTKNKTTFTTEFSKDQLLRFYALSLNPLQRRKLAAQGIGEVQMEGIKKHLGKEAIEFADKVVAYLSTEYYESVNDVYRDVNDANLSYIENYFPTMTTQADVDAKQLFQGDFNGIFNAESAPALKNRTDMTSDIDLTGASFSTALESHIKTMEHYKAYAADVKALNTVVNTNAFDAVLKGLGIKTMVKQSINNAINPDSAKNSLDSAGTLFNMLQTKFTGFALAFKVMQVAKQATSFINAFEQYSYRKGKRVGYGADLFIDVLPFIADYTAVLLNARKYHALMQDISPTYRYRVQQGVKGDLAALESGSPTHTSLKQASTKRAKAWRGFTRAGASPTVIGDLLGVAGYAANFRRDIKNGMSQEKAVAKFNEYNATQQTRRASERSVMQQNTNYLVRAFTMFGSTPILLINNVMQALNSMTKNGFTTQNTRKLILNLGMANAAFVAMSNIGILLHGDDEERRAVLTKIALAAAGLNLVYQAPFIGQAAVEVVNWATGERRPNRGGVNPFISLIHKMKKASADDRAVMGGIQTMVEIAAGAQIDPLLGLIESVRDIDEASWNEAADILGISSSYRPEAWEKDYVAPTPSERRAADRKARDEARPSFIAKEKRAEAKKKRDEERKERRKR